MTEPRTETGRRTLADWDDDPATKSALRVAILAIEAEARSAALREVQDALDILWPGGGVDVGAFGRGQALAVVDRLFAEGVR